MERERIEAHEAIELPAPPRRAKLVLIVDDEVSIAETVAAVVELAEYEPLIAHSGKEALELVRQQWPAMVISDVMMPVMDGPKFVVALRRQAARWGMPIPPIVLMTAASQRAIEGVAVDAVVPKPFEITTIEALLHRFLRDAS